MKQSKTTAIIAAGIVGALALGSVAIAGAAGVKAVQKSLGTTASADSTTTAPGKGAPPANGAAGDRRGPDGARHGRGGEGDIAEALAKLSGLTEAEIRTKREAGTSYAAIAKSKDVSVDALIAETVKIETAELDAELKAGTMTEAEKTAVLKDIDSRLKTAIESTDAFGPKDGGRHGKGGHGRGDFDGDGPKRSGSTSSTTGSAQ